MSLRSWFVYRIHVTQTWSRQGHCLPLSRSEGSSWIPAQATLRPLSARGEGDFSIVTHQCKVEAQASATASIPHDERDHHADVAEHRGRAVRVAGSARRKVAD